MRVAVTNFSEMVNFLHHIYINSSQDKHLSLSLQPALYQLELEGLPPDPSSMVSACVISQSHAHSWPLVCDPFSMAGPWISHHYQSSHLVQSEVGLLLSSAS